MVRGIASSAAYRFAQKTPRKPSIEGLGFYIDCPRCKVYVGDYTDDPQANLAFI